MVELYLQHKIEELAENPLLTPQIPEGLLTPARTQASMVRGQRGGV
jgi:hypothetical protein